MCKSLPISDKFFGAFSPKSTLKTEAATKTTSQLQSEMEELERNGNSNYTITLFSFLSVSKECLLLPTLDQKLQQEEEKVIYLFSEDTVPGV